LFHETAKLGEIQAKPGRKMLDFENRNEVCVLPQQYRNAENRHLQAGITFESRRV
jgi:hypothetical protein